MTDVNNWDNIEEFLLKECYDLASQYEKHDGARDILREKSKQIKIPNDYVPVQEDAVYRETEMQIVTEAIYGLTLEGFAASDNSVFRYAHKINNLPSSAEKEYILALLALRGGTNETHRLEALKHITIALGYSPDDPRYLALASVLQNVDM